MAEQGSGEKTEQPTPKRKRELRRKGVVARTPELTVWGGLLVALTVMPAVLGGTIGAYHEMLSRMLDIMRNPEEKGALAFIGWALSQSVIVVVPLFVVLIIFTVVASVAQTRGMVSFALLAPKAERISIPKGLKKLFSVQSLWQVGKSVAKLALLIFIAWGPVRNSVVRFIASGPMSPGELASTLAAQTLALVQLVSLGGLGLAAIDYLFMRRKVRRQSLMSKQEVRQEHSDQEGNPEIRGRRRSLQRRLAFEVRQLHAARSATVVVVNPTHYAVAFRYDPAWGPPKVVARGVDRLALQIRESAINAGVPVVEDPQLARFLHASTRLNAAIGEELFGVLAVLLHFIDEADTKGQLIRPSQSLLGRAGLSISST